MSSNSNPRSSDYAEDASELIAQPVSSVGRGKSGVRVRASLEPPQEWFEDDPTQAVDGGTSPTLVATETEMQALREASRRIICERLPTPVPYGSEGNSPEAGPEEDTRPFRFVSETPPIEEVPTEVVPLPRASRTRSRATFLPWALLIVGALAVLVLSMLLLRDSPPAALAPQASVPAASGEPLEDQADVPPSPDREPRAPEMTWDEPLEEELVASAPEGAGDASRTPSLRRWRRALARGRRLLDAGDHQRAEWSFERAVQYNPDDVDTHVALAEARLAQGKVRAARRAYRRALDLDPQHPAATAGLTVATANAVR
jgi:hypothetical protein